jgi:FkbM family methyltransferase
MNLDTWFDTSTALSSNTVISSVLHHLPERGTLYDVGANVGVVTAAVVENAGRVFAFEPHPVYRDYMAKRFREHMTARYPKVKLYPFALGASFSKETLYCDERNPGWNTFVQEMTTPEMTEMAVEVRPLDSLEPDYMDVLKIDVEGSEADVIDGAQQTIQRLKPVIVMELGWGKSHPQREEQVAAIEWLFSIGYGRVDYDVDGTTDVTLVA